MKAITLEEVQAWLERVNASKVDIRNPILFQHKIRFLKPQDGGKEIVLARELMHFFRNESNGLLWFSEYGIFPSLMNIELFDGYRRSININTSICETPGHLFNSNDIKQIECLVDLGLLFHWDIFLVGASLSLLFFSDHHDRCAAQVATEEKLLEIREILLKLHLTPSDLPNQDA